MPGFHSLIHSFFWKAATTAAVLCDEFCCCLFLFYHQIQDYQNHHTHRIMMMVMMTKTRIMERKKLFFRSTHTLTAHSHTHVLFPSPSLLFIPSCVSSHSVVSPDLLPETPHLPALTKRT
jgi:hypothetical protein